MKDKLTTLPTSAKAALLLRIALQICCLGTAAAAGSKSHSNPPPKLNVQDAPLSPQVKAATSFAPVIKKIAPSVVNIYSTMIVRERQTSNPFLDDPIFRQFFGDRFRQSQPREQKAQGLGAGTIVTSDGYILTANHVIEGADSVRVALAASQKEYDAKIIGADPPT